MGAEFEALAQWLRAVGAVGVANVGGLFAALAGICFTLLQLRMLRRQLKLNALIRIMDSNRAIVALGFEHPAVWAAMGEETPTVFGDEAVLHRRYRQLWMNHMQIMWSARRLGSGVGFRVGSCTARTWRTFCGRGACGGIGQARSTFFSSGLSPAGGRPFPASRRMQSCRREGNLSGKRGGQGSDVERSGQFLHAW